MVDPNARKIGERRSRRVSPRVLAIVALSVATVLVAAQQIGGRRSSSNTEASPETTPAVPQSDDFSIPTTAADPASIPLTPAPKPLPDGGLFPGGRPPMFVLVSFDGAADQALLKRWMDTTAKAKANMTLFLSSVYLLDEANKSAYDGPRHGPGESEIKFAPTNGAPVKEWLRTTIMGLQDAQRAGHQLENHFGGHWCGPSGVSSWNRRDWAEEIDQFEKLVYNLDELNGLDPPVGSPFLNKPTGTRTPCLEGNLDELFPVLKARGYKYDASRTRGLNEWPTRRLGLWSFGFPAIRVDGLTRPVLTVDFSLRESLDASHNATPAQSADISRRVLDGFRRSFDGLYYGNRAPFELANHFVTFSNDAFNVAVEKFLLEVCPKDEVYCVSYRQLSEWLDVHEAAIEKFEAASFTRAVRPGA
jgi:hypothetical protein